MKRLILWTNLLALAGCAPSILPAPQFTATAPVPDPLLMSVEASAAGHDAAADAALNDLSDAEPDSRVVPEFGADEISWDIDVRTFASHPRVQVLPELLPGRLPHRDEGLPDSWRSL